MDVVATVMALGSVVEDRAIEPSLVTERNVLDGVDDIGFMVREGDDLVEFSVVELLSRDDLRLTQIQHCELDWIGDGR